MAKGSSKNKNYSKNKGKSKPVYRKQRAVPEIEESENEQTREEDNILYKVKELYLGSVGYYDDYGIVIQDTHVFTHISEEEAFDLNTNSIVYSKGPGRVFFYKSLIPFEFFLMKSRINYGAFHRRDALKAGYYYKDDYFSFLKTKNMDPYTLELGLKR